MTFDLCINGVGPYEEEGRGRCKVRDRAMTKDALMDNEQVDEMVDQSLGYRLYDNTQQSTVHLIGASTLSPTITCRGSNGP